MDSPRTAKVLARCRVIAFACLGGAVQANAGSRVISLVGDPSSPEGGAVQFDVLATAGPVPVTVQFGTVDGTATVADNDYFAFSGTLTFPPSGGILQHTLFVGGMEDVRYEADETFFMVLSNPSAGATIADGESTGTILNNDPPQPLGAGDATTSEGDAGVSAVLVPVSFEFGDPSGLPATVGFETADGTAQAGTDYVATSGTLSFAAGDVTRFVTVSVRGDVLDEPDEAFFVNLTSAAGATITDAQGVVTIRDDDAPLELAHGSMMRRVLGPSPIGQPRHVYRIGQQPLSSYEVVLDEASGDSTPLGLQLVASDGTTVLAESDAVGSGPARSLRWTNTRTTDVTNETVRVSSGGCATDCGPDDTYRIRAYDVTLGAPRFNNTGSQVTLLILQNAGPVRIDGTVHFRDQDGGLLATDDFTIDAHGTFVLNTASIAGLSGAAGSLSIVHQGRHGTLVGKAVGVEPATGFTFDTPLFARSR